MREMLITSSVLILVMALLRYLLRGRISLRLQYALWLVVAVRLLVPVSLPGSRVSVLNVVPQAAQQAALPRWEGVPALSQQGQEAGKTPNFGGVYSPVSGPDSPEKGPVEGSDGTHSDPVSPGAPIRGDGDAPSLWESLPAGGWTQLLSPGATPAVDWVQVLTVVWLCGVALMGVWLFCVNLFFRRHARRGARPLAAEGCPVPVFVSGGVSSPCLVGLLRPAVYVTPDCAGDGRRLRHVLAHELTHLRHRDPMWALVRGVCLCLYWFDPLVWWAADLSRRDCELACDEGAIARLGEPERLAYGKTLVDMAAVSASPGRLLQTATTMTDRKGGIMERVKLIAKKPRVAAAAVALAILVTLVTAACTFTGAQTQDPAESGKPAESSKPAESVAPVEVFGPAALTGEELEWFNEQFFNSSGSNQSQLYATWGDGTREYYNIRNQFANPLNLYDKPENIDLYQLFYCDGTIPFSEEELKAVFGYESWNDLPCPASKLTGAEMDALLQANTGLTSADTAKKGLDGFTYSAQYDAYYWMHGDTNYCGYLDFLCGTRETTGSSTLIRLYHNSNFNGNNWYCVTLEEGEDGTYWFVSNQVCEHPAIPTVLPGGEPAAVISLKDLEPYAAQAVAVTQVPGPDDTTQYTASWNFDGRHVCIYGAEDGKYTAAYEDESGVYHAFLTGQSNMYFFHDLLGRDGFYVDYSAEYSEQVDGYLRDLYCFNGDGALVLLARCRADSTVIHQVDLDGDGVDELAAGRQIFFLRDGVVYEADLEKLLLEACPELNYWDYFRWEPYGRYLYANGLTDWDDETGGAMWERYLYFDGENILVYKIDRAVIDHVAEGADTGIPGDVVEQAKSAFAALLTEQADGTFRLADGGGGEYDMPIDDWRITSLSGPRPFRLGDTVIRCWSYGGQIHTTAPEKFVWAGGSYLTEDGWAGVDHAGFSGCLAFLETGEGQEFLFTFENDEGELDSIWGRQWFFRDLEEHGVDVSPTSYAALEFQLVLESLTYGEPVLLTCSDPGGGGGAVTSELTTPGAAECLEKLRSGGGTSWERAEAPDREPDGASVILSDSDWYELIQVWDNGLVKTQRDSQEAKWYTVDGTAGELPYPLLRAWFDKAYAGQ